jgi:uncharacterized protein (TIGR02246 family)
MRCILVLALALSLQAASEEVAIKKVLDDQVNAWNRGDLDSFVRSYENSPAITFIGKTVSRGYDGVLTRYRTNYPDKLHMGTLFFEEVEVRLLGKEHALVIGRFVLDRTQAGGGPASGRWTLVGHKTKDGWKFIHDHTSN